jgi:chloramphenicol 3-O phosphotransferase
MHAPSGPPGQIVLLNGVSSSGQTSIAEQLLSVLQRPWFHLPVDAVNGMRAKHRTLALSPAELDVVLARTRAGFHRAVAGMAAAGNNVVMDHVLSERWRLLDCLTVLADFDVAFVGVRCAPAELARRELLRGDREPGPARSTAPCASRISWPGLTRRPRSRSCGPGRPRASCCAANDPPPRPVR